MKQLKSLLFAVAVTAVPSSASAQSIGLFADVGAINCNVNASVGTPVTCYFVFRQLASTGIAGYAFRAHGLPAGWIAIADPCWPSPCIGDLFGSGVVGAWPECHTNDVEFLFPLVLIAMTDQSDIELTIAPRLPLVNPAFDCPLVARCDAPTYTAECVTGSRSVINGTLPCTVGTHMRSWAEIKSLYE